MKAPILVPFFGPAKFSPESCGEIPIHFRHPKSKAKRAKTTKQASPCEHCSRVIAMGLPFVCCHCNAVPAKYAAKAKLHDLGPLAYDRMKGKPKEKKAKKAKKAERPNLTVKEWSDLFDEAKKLGPESAAWVALFATELPVSSA